MFLPRQGTAEVVNLERIVAFFLVSLVVVWDWGIIAFRVILGIIVEVKNLQEG